MSDREIREIFAPINSVMTEDKQTTGRKKRKGREAKMKMTLK